MRVEILYWLSRPVFLPWVYILLLHGKVMSLRLHGVNEWGSSSSKAEATGIEWNCLPLSDPSVRTVSLTAQRCLEKVFKCFHTLLQQRVLIALLGFNAMCRDPQKVHPEYRSTTEIAYQRLPGTPDSEFVHAAIWHLLLLGALSYFWEHWDFSFHWAQNIYISPGLKKVYIYGSNNLIPILS